MSNNRPNATPGQGQSKPLPEGSQSANHIPINMPTDDAQTLVLKRRLLVAQTKLLDIGRILKNDHYQVGYLVDAGPIKNVLKRPEE